MAEKLNTQYGIKTNLQTTSSSTAGIAHLSNGASSNNVNNNGLDNPDDGSNINVMSNPVHHNANQSMDNFKNHSGNVVGNQIEEQAKTLENADIDVVNAAGGLAKQVVTSAITPPFKTFNEEASENIQDIKEFESKKGKQ